MKLNRNRSFHQTFTQLRDRNKMAQLTDEQVVAVIDTINLFDKKGDGKFPTDSMINILRALGLNPLKVEVEKITRDIKEYEKQSRVDVEDFLPIYEYFLKKKKPTFQDLCDGLKSLNPSQAEEGKCLPRARSV